MLNVIVAQPLCSVVTMAVTYRQVHIVLEDHYFAMYVMNLVRMRCELRSIEIRNGKVSLVSHDALTHH